MKGHVIGPYTGAGHAFELSDTGGGRLLSVAWWIWFGVPLLTILVGWTGFLSQWSTVKGRAIRLLVSIALVFPGGAVLLIGRGLVHPPHVETFLDEVGFYSNIFLVSLGGVLFGVPAAIASRRWFSFAALAISTWLCILSLFMASAVD